MLKRLSSPTVGKIWIICGFVLVSGVALARHEMWRDELQAWMLARDSTSILSLVQNASYEGHPVLWHLCLYGLSQFTASPVAMQLFQLGVAAGTVGLIALLSPFSIAHRVLLCSGYFVLYEYTAISRSYSLTLFLCLLFCAAYRRLQWSYAGLGVILGLLANTTAYGVVLSGVLMLFLGLDWPGSGGGRSLSGLRAAWGIAGLGIALSVWQIGRRPLAQLLAQLLAAADDQGATLVSASGTAPAATGVAKLITVTADIWKAYVPIPLPHNGLHFWNTNLLHGFSYKFAAVTPYGALLGDGLACGLALGLVGLVALSLWPNRPVLWTYLSGTATIWLFRYLIHGEAFLRHQGHYVILLMVCYWLAQSPSRQGQTRRWRKAFQYQLFTALLCLQAIAGIYATAMDYRHPFSSSRAAATYLQRNGLETAALFGSRYRQASVISGYLDVPIYYPEKGDTGTFWTTRLPEITSEAQLMEQIKLRLAEVAEGQLVLILTDPVSKVDPDLDLQTLAQFESSIVYENFYLYSAQLKP